MNYIIQYLSYRLSLLFSQPQAKEYTSILTRVATSLRHTAAVGSYPRKRVQLDIGNYSVTLQALNPEDLNSVINVVFQVLIEEHGSVYRNTPIG